MKWPLFSVVLVYSVGVLLGNFASLPPGFLLLAGAGLVVLALAWARTRPLLMYAAVLVTGCSNYTLKTAVLSPHDLRFLIGAEPKLATVRGVLIETPGLRVFELGEIATWRTLARADIFAIQFEKGEWQPARGQIAVTTPGTLTNLFGAQTVEISGVIAVPKGPVAEGTFDYRTFLARQEIYYRLQADSEQDWKIIASPKRPPLADRFREWARQVLSRDLPIEDESLRLEWALTLGWKTAFTEKAMEPFIQAATYHIFAVDGLRMAIIFGILFGLLRACTVPRWICGLALLPFIWFYVALTGWPASAIRATVMLSIIILGWVLKRPSSLLNSLFAAALIILVWEPQQLFQAGFQLSFIVVLVLILLMPAGHALMQRLFAPEPMLPIALRRRWPAFLRVPARYCGDLLLTSFVAWIASIPLVAYYFNVITPVSTPANVIAVPLCALVLMSNFGSLLLAPWFGAASALFNHAGWFLMECIRVSSNWFADWPMAWGYVAAPNLFTTTLYYALLLALATGWFMRPKLRALRIFAASGALAVWCSFWLPGLFHTRLTILPANGGLVTWFDAPGTSRDLLVDSGNTNAVQFVTKPFLQAQGVNRIQNLLLTHGDLHHVGGAEMLAQEFAVRRVWASPLRFRSSAYKRILNKFGQRHDFLQSLFRGKSIGAWEVIHPAPDDRFSKADDGALVLRANIHGMTILLLSDLGRAGQNVLLQREPDLRADIVVVGLPAAGEPVCDALLDAVQPRLIIVADSEYPVSERAGNALRRRLDCRNCPVVYTRSSGAVMIEFGRSTFEFHTMRGCQLDRHLPAKEDSHAAEQAEDASTNASSERDD